MIDVATPPLAIRSPDAKRVLVLGATGAMGRGAAGSRRCVFVRPRAGVGSALTPDDSAKLLQGSAVRFGQVTDPASLVCDGFCGERFDALVSCLASRTGLPKDAWAIDYRAPCRCPHNCAGGRSFAHGALIGDLRSEAASRLPASQAGVRESPTASGLTYSIVRPTAFFKSLSGQVDRIKRGKPFMVFGDGALTACKLISDDDVTRSTWVASSLNAWRMKVDTIAWFPSAVRGSDHAETAGRVSVCLVWAQAALHPCAF